MKKPVRLLKPVVLDGERHEVGAVLDADSIPEEELEHWLTETGRGPIASLDEEE